MAFEGLSSEREEDQAAEAPAEAGTPATATTGAAVVTAMNAADAKAHVQTLTATETLDAAEAAEAQHEKFPGGRVSVLRAITERREELAAAMSAPVEPESPAAPVTEPGDGA